MRKSTVQGSKIIQAVRRSVEVVILLLDFFA